MVDVLFQCLLELPFFVIGLLFCGAYCPKCGADLKYRGRMTEGERLQCVMCEREWLKGKRGRLLPVMPANNR